MSMNDWISGSDILILMACRPIKGYFIPRVLGIAIMAFFPHFCGVLL